MIWARISDYAITNGTHTICKCLVEGLEKFVLTENPNKRIDIFETSEAAKRYVRKRIGT